MKFFEWTTDYQLYKKVTPKKEQLPYKEFLIQRYDDLRSYGAIPLRLYAEDCWMKEGQPYYNIHPEMVSKLCKVDLSKIPSTMFQMPHGCRVVNIRFAKQHKEFTVDEEMVSYNKTVTTDSYGVMPAGSFCHGLIMMDNRAVKGLGNISFVTDFGIYNEHNQPTYTMLGIVPTEGKSLEETFPKSASDIPSYVSLLRNILSLAVTIGFLSDNPTICEHDVLTRDKHKMPTATEQDRQVMINRAKRKGKIGYNIGSDLMFLGKQPLLGTNGPRNLTGRELEYAHIRAGHPHAVRYGKGKKLVKIMWYAPTTVRDDLPFKKES